MYIIVQIAYFRDSLKTTVKTTGNNGHETFEHKQTFPLTKWLSGEKKTIKSCPNASYTGYQLEFDKYSHLYVGPKLFFGTEPKNCVYS